MSDTSDSFDSEFVDCDCPSVAACDEAMWTWDWSVVTVDSLASDAVV